VRDAHNWLEDAHSALDAFVRNSYPRKEESSINVLIMINAAQSLRKLISNYEGYFEEITEGLPEGEA